MAREYAVLNPDGSSRPSGQQVAQLFDAAIKRGEIREGVGYEFRNGRFIESGHLSGRKQSTAGKSTHTIAQVRERLRQYEREIERDEIKLLRIRAGVRPAR